MAAKLVKPDGIICGGDWRDDPSRPHYGVRRAVEEFAPRVTSSWSIRVRTIGNGR
jgi:hypothetical protein